MTELRNSKSDAAAEVLLINGTVFESERYQDPDVDRALIILRQMSTENGPPTVDMSDIVQFVEQKKVLADKYPVARYGHIEAVFTDKSGTTFTVSTQNDGTYVVNKSLGEVTSLVEGFLPSATAAVGAVVVSSLLLPATFVAPVLGGVAGLIASLLIRRSRKNKASENNNEEMDNKVKA